MLIEILSIFLSSLPLERIRDPTKESEGGTLWCGRAKLQSRFSEQKVFVVVVIIIIVVVSFINSPLLPAKIIYMISVLISCRKVVEHVCLLKAKEDLSEEEENDMLDYLYTTQYQMGGIVAISLGRCRWVYCR